MHSFSTGSSRYFLIVQRNAGSISGKHYHTGLCDSKSPEILLLIKGRAKVIAKTLKSEIVEEQVVEESTLIEIPSGIYHELHALTDVAFIEFYREECHLGEDTFYVS